MPCGVCEDGSGITADGGQGLRSLQAADDGSSLYASPCDGAGAIQ